MFETYNIKQPIWFIIACLLFIIISYLVVDRLYLLQTGERVIGQVVDISSENDRCGSSKHKYNCTRFTAFIDYTTLKGVKSQFNIGAGNCHGRNETINYADKQIGENVKVIYSPTNNNKVYEDTLFGVWGAPIYAFFFQIISLFSAFSEPRRRRSY